MTDLASYLSASRITQAAFAEQIGVSQPTVNRWLRGMARPSWRTAAEIERATGGAVPVAAWAEHVSSPSADAPASAAEG